MIGITHRSRDFIFLMNASPNASPERNITERKENHENSKSTCFRPYSPQSRHECMDREELVRCVSVVVYLGTMVIR
jgi:hypothetical protein